jgi:plasmid stabilization system protein ParE
MTLTVLAGASAEMYDAADYYTERVPGLGDRFLAAVEQLYEQIEASPLRFGHLETVPDSIDIRRALVLGYPYYVAYQILENEILVLAVAHGSREPNYWIDRAVREGE